MKIENFPIQEINPSIYNPRIMTKDEFDGLIQSIRLFGQVENLIINKDKVLISGHQRLEAMKRLGMKEVACLTVDLPEELELALNLEMNNTHIQGTFDEIKLSEILERIKLDDNYKKLRLDRLEVKDLSIQENEEPEFIYSKELKESHNYLVLYFDNDIDWKTAEEMFEIKPVHDLLSKPGYIKKGIGRVINGSSAIEKLRNQAL